MHVHAKIVPMNSELIVNVDTVLSFEEKLSALFENMGAAAALEKEAINDEVKRAFTFERGVDALKVEDEK